MSYARLRSELLAAREAREALIGSILARLAMTIIFASTAVPGPRKRPPAIEALLDWGVGQLEDGIDNCRLLINESDSLGPYAIFSVDAKPRVVKLACLAIENGHPAARLLDLDVYGADTARIGRVDVGAPPRPCLLCEQPAVDCIRLNRHPMEALLERVQDLLEAFNATATG